MKKTRRLVQLGFVILTVGGVFVFGGNAERWCPFGGVEALYSYATEGNMLCSLGISNFYILGAVLVMTLLLRRAFCGYMCPIGSVSEWLQGGAARFGIKAARLPDWLDRSLSLLKYPVLIAILWFTYQAAELVLRAYDPCYVLISRHGKDITVWAYVITGAIALASLIVVMPFCRWLCPLAAVLNPFSRFGLTRIRRNSEVCVDCGQCATACPMNIPVDKLHQVTAARCLACMDCVAACPPPASGALTWGPAGRRGRSWPMGLVVVILLACAGAAVAASHFFPLPSFVKTRGQAPAVTATTELQIHGLTCRGKSGLLMYYLERDDMFGLSGYLKLEAWPGPDAAEVHIIYDPAWCNEPAIMRAITEAYFDATDGAWQIPPFVIVGYDPLGGLDDPGADP